MFVVCSLRIGHQNYKQKSTNQGVKDQASEFALANVTPISHSAKYCSRKN